MRPHSTHHRPGGGSLAAGKGAPSWTENFNYTGPSDSTFLANWQVSTYLGSPYISENVQFASANITFPTNLITGAPCLAMKMTQTSSTNCTGAEIVSQNALNGSTGLGNYGTYEWRARWGSSSATPNGAGSAASGGVSSIFLYNGNNTTGVDYVEVDAPEAEGIYTTKAGYATFNGTGGGPNATTPPTGSGFTWDSVIGDDSYMAVSGPDTGYHYYGLIWSSGSLVFYLDGVLQGSTTTNVPVPNLGGFITNIDCNHYGTNSAGFGGTWSSGTRYAYVISIKYWS